MTIVDSRLLVLLAALTACKGGDETDTDAAEVALTPSVSAVIPSVVYAERRVEIAISGFATDWTDTVQIDFGEGIEVVDYTVASPTAILADVQIHRDATLGVRDVVITQGDATTTYAGAFEVRSPVEIAVHGTLAQGSILVGEATQSDPSTLFDDSQYCDYFGCFYTNMDATFDLDGLYPQFDVVGPRYAEFLVLVDVHAETGVTDMAIHSGPSFATDTSTVPDLFAVEARTPKQLVEGSNTGSVATAYGTEVWELDAGDAEFVELVLTTEDVEAEPYFALLDSSGSFVDGFIAYTDAYELDVSEAEGPYYLVVFDGYGVESYEYDLTVDFLVPPAPAPDDTCATVASTTAMPIHGADGALDWYDDEDWYRIDVAQPDVGKVLHVVTEPGDDYADTLVEVYTGACDALTLVYMSDASPVLDPEWHEDVTTDPLAAAGTYYVVIKANEYFYDFAETAYKLDVTLEDAP